MVKKKADNRWILYLFLIVAMWLGAYLFLDIIII